MNGKPWLLVSSLLVLVGCAATPPAPSSVPWQDAAFQHDPALVGVGRDDLFRLEPALAAQLRATRGSATSQRLDQLLALIFGPDGHGFTYSTGRSTTAMETWQQRSGNCLSLTVLTYAAARAMGLPAQMQDVPVPVFYERRGTLELRNEHVNVLFPGAQRDTAAVVVARDVIIDFEPEQAAPRRGKPLSEAQILARYYNNVAAEHLEAGRDRAAYAWFKAAVEADPSFAAAYGNLAVVYRRKGLDGAAEQLLRHALTLADPPDVPLHTLHQLLADQGRDAEAAHYAQLLQDLRGRDPAYWTGLGLQYLNQGDARRAIGALERARSMTAGFQEVHRFLAVAYWRAGEKGKADAELAQLAALGGGDAKVSGLRKKFGNAQPEGSSE